MLVAFFSDPFSKSSLLTPVPALKVLIISLFRIGATNWRRLRAALLLPYQLGRHLQPLLFHSCTAHDIIFLINHSQFFNTFEDLPWSLVYPETTRLYPDAKFIL
jgi:hypothetical protein